MYKGFRHYICVRLVKIEGTSMYDAYVRQFGDIKGYGIEPVMWDATLDEIYEDLIACRKSDICVSIEVA